MGGRYGILTDNTSPFWQFTAIDPSTGLPIADPSLNLLPANEDGTQAGIVSTGLANPDLTWEKIKIYNAAVDFSFFKRKLESPPQQ